jgi:DNA-binding CsgD family transcriptional regulator
MDRDKSILLEQIHSTIRAIIVDLNVKNHGEILLNEESKPAEISERLENIREYMPIGKILQSIAWLEQRIETLEKQNDNLFYFIHFIYENFGDLVIKNISPGRNSMTTEKSKHTSDKEKHNSKATKITRREAEVLSSLVKGNSIKEIASALFISENTVITHKKNLKEKFHARNTAELISKAFQLTH